MATYGSYLEYILNSLINKNIKRNYNFQADFSYWDESISIIIYDVKHKVWHGINYKPRKSDNINALVLQLFFATLNDIPSYKTSKVKKKSKLGKLLYK